MSYFIKVIINIYMFSKKIRYPILILFLIIFSNENNLKDAVYVIMHKNKYIIFENNDIKLSINSKTEKFTNFRINRVSYNSSYSFIKNIKYNKYLSISNTNFDAQISKSKNIDDLKQWTFLNVQENNFKILNKNDCYLIVYKDNLKCKKISLEEATTFLITMLYEEVKFDSYNNFLVNKEPIDVIIKYIDLMDPELNRTGIHQLKKDIDNEELKYSVRSILTNIPWVRYIFILMPNKKVKYFKDYSLIQKKIKYINDKDFLGFDSANSYSFQFRYYNLKKYGISDNFIVMDDDYFIGSPLKKTDFFYVENGKVVPAIITSTFLEIDKYSCEEKCKFFKYTIEKNKEEQTSNVFDYSLYLTYLLFIKKMNSTIMIPKQTHNAIPVNINDLEEIYQMVLKSELKDKTLNSIYRPSESFQFTGFIFCYTFLIKRRKINSVSYRYININNSLLVQYRTSLFCLNTGALYYSPLTFLKTRIVMEKLFPYPTIYELIDYSFPEIAYYVVKSLNDQIDEYGNKMQNYNILILFTINIFLFLFKWKFVYLNKCN